MELEEREQGLLARNFVVRWFNQHGRFSCGQNDKWLYLVHTMSSDAFGRYLGEITCLKNHSLNDDLLQSGHAKPYRRLENDS